MRALKMRLRWLWSKKPQAVATSPGASPRSRSRLAARKRRSVRKAWGVRPVSRRKLRLSWPEVTDALAAIRACCPPPRPLTLATHEAALGLAERYGFSIYDALIVAAALEAGCATLFSEDMQDGQVVEGQQGRVTIRNPFAAA